MYPRWTATDVETALSDTPVAMLVGPRRAGKTTLAQAVAAGDPGASYVTLDDVPTLDTATRDPVGFIERLEQPAVIDEIQRAPELLLPIKVAVDRERRPGRFLLTGSAQVLLLPRVSESLAGRMEPLALWPLSQGELAGTRERFVERLFEEPEPDPPAPPEESAPSRDELIERICRGGFPEALERSAARRADWFDAYLTTVIERDVRDLADIERLTELPRLLSSLALRTRAPLNKSDVSATLDIPRTTLDRYLTLLRHVFMVVLVPGWSGSAIKQLSKAPKLVFGDSGLLAHLLGADPDRLRRDPTLFGIVLEGFVGSELLKQIGWARPKVSLFHLRTAKGGEIDFVLERRDRQVAAVEVKATETIRTADFRRLATLRDRLGDRFSRGTILYTGTQSLPFGDRLTAHPLPTLWAP